MSYDNLEPYIEVEADKQKYHMPKAWNYNTHQQVCPRNIIGVREVDKVLVQITRNIFNAGVLEVK